MKRNIYKNCKVGGKICDLEVTNGKFSAIGKLRGDGIDLGGAEVFPGLVDIHTHGSLGRCLVTDDKDELKESLCIISEYFANSGVTTWYPTTTVPAERLSVFDEIDLDAINGANMPGIHLEGPYISPKKPGAIPLWSMRLPKVSEVKGNEKIKYITIAPELDGAMDFIRELSGDVKFSIGHTCADYDTAIEAINAGADCLNHTFNALPPLNHREPGPIGAGMEMGIYAEAISDGVHLHPSVIKMLYRVFGKERMILVSDSVSVSGLPDGQYTGEGRVRIIKDSIIRNENGNLAGSWCNLFEDVRRTVRFGIPREDVYYMASTTPAEYMGLNKGKIEVGYDADFIVVTPDDELLKTVIDGEIFFEKN
ncbi:MAG: amidohydrolase family protein [Clostridia bacterium]|nr:amidohydrolase family protein [Clostridia bacterium]